MNYIHVEIITLPVVLRTDIEGTKMKVGKPVWRLLQQSTGEMMVPFTRVVAVTMWRNGQIPDMFCI